MSNTETVRRYLRLLEEKDIQGWIELWDDNADHYYPFGTEIFPGHLTGKGAILERWRDIPNMFEVLRFPIHEIWEDGDAVIARFDSDNVMKGGRAYRNTYVCIFRFNEDGKIREYREYFDPIVAGVDYGLLEVKYHPAA
jgi:ketosteroid isomerase-like protein